MSFIILCERKLMIRAKLLLLLRIHRANRPGPAQPELQSK